MFLKCGVVPDSPTCGVTHLLCPLPAQFSQCRHWAWAVDCKGVETHQRPADRVKTFILLPSGGCELLCYVHTLGRLQADAASWILFSAGGGGDSKVQLYTGYWCQDRCSKAGLYTGCWSQVKLTGG